MLNRKRILRDNKVRDKTRYRYLHFFFVFIFNLLYFV